jgi:hypothetical protein
MLSLPTRPWWILWIVFVLFALAPNGVSGNQNSTTISTKVGTFGGPVSGNKLSVPIVAVIIATPSVLFTVVLAVIYCSSKAKVNGSGEPEDALSEDLIRLEEAAAELTTTATGQPADVAEAAKEEREEEKSLNLKDLSSIPIAVVGKSIEDSFSAKAASSHSTSSSSNHPPSPRTRQAPPRRLRGNETL